MAQPLSPGSNRNGNRFRIVYCCLALLIVLQPARIRGQQEVPLEPDRPIERELAGGQSHLYQFMLEAGQYVKITIEQRGIDVMARLSGLGGKESAEFDSEIRNQGTEVVEWVAEAAGPRQLVVQSKQKDAAPGRYEIRLATPRAATADETALNEALRLYEEHLKLRREAKYDQALPLVERSLQIRERVLGPDHRLVANSVNGLAIIYSQKGEYAKAAPLFLRALTVLEKVLGPDHLQVSNLLNNLGNFYYLYGKYPEAERFHRRALTIRERAPGAEPLLVAQSLHNLGSVYDVLGDYVRAESAYQRALNIREKALGAEHILVADTAYNLGLVYDEKGDLARAEPLHRRALAIREKLLGPEHPDVAASLDMLASCYLAEDRESEARQSLQRALEIREKVLGPDHPEVAVSLNNLAMFHDEHGDNAKAEQMARRALVIKERAFGSEHPETAWTLNVLGNIYRDSGEYAKARPLLRRALEIQERAGGPQHPQVAVYLGSLARVYAAEGDLAQAISIQSRANAVSEHHLVLNLAVGSERQKLRYLALFSKETDYTLTLHDRAAPDNPQALELAFTTLLRRKGRGLDAVTDTVAALRRRAASEDQQLFDRLAETRSQLAGLILKAPGPDNPEAYRTQLAALEETSERLESELSSRSREFGQQLQPATIAAVQAALPAGCALIEFAVYTPEDLRTGKRQSPRYLAYLLTAQGPPRWTDLGEAAPIDLAIGLWRKALRDPKRADVKRLARAVDDRVMRPIRSLLEKNPGETLQLLIAPDGLLNLAPFAALVDEQNRYLVERYAISYLTSGRDLLRASSSQPNRNEVLIVANPAFGPPAIVEAKPADRQAGTQGQVRIDSTQLYFRPLPYTDAEAEAIKTLVPGARMLRLRAATETAVKQARAPRILHIATHGFFLNSPEAPPERSNEDPRRWPDLRLGKWALYVKDPLLRSGLALAGANRGVSADDDGVLTALEVAGLDLWGTELVVLSACDTGVGEVKNGDGVYGLRRALVLAGSETQIMSLWPVSDQATRDLMVSYYRGLTQGQGRGEALRLVQLEMLKDLKRQHPFYWASFIQSGEWTKLEAP